MKTRNRVSCFMPWLYGILTVCVLQACIKEDRSDCGLNVQFRYTYNILDADAFTQEADEVKLWVFDADNRLVAQYEEEGIREIDNFQLHIPYLPAGEYSFVAWARSTDKQGEYADFELPELNNGALMEELTARLPRENDGTHRDRLNSLLNGTLKASVTGRLQTVTVDMMKCTHTLRIILMPMQGDKVMSSEDFHFRIEDKTGWLAYDASPYREDKVAYHPYYQEATSDPSATDGETISSALVAELNTSRLMTDAEPRLIISDAETGEEVMNLNLTWFLSLQAIGEHRAEWSDQEYLDRQDEYALTFFIDVDNNTWMKSHIVVNGWVVSLEEIEL